MNSGWIKLHRKFLKSAIWLSSDSYLIQLFFYCLFEANWEDKEVVIGNEVVKLKRGQFITGRKSLVKNLTNLKREDSHVFKKMESLYRRKLFLLQKLQFLAINSTNKYSVITVQKYNEYQMNDQGNGQQMTNNGPTDGQQMATTKEYKNIRIKEERGIAYLLEIPPRDMENFTKTFVCTDRQVKSKAEALYDYCKSSGKVYKDYSALLRNALRKDFGDRPQPLIQESDVELSPQEKANAERKLQEIRDTLKKKMSVS